MLWGRNEKTKLTVKILRESKVPFTHLELSDYLETANFKDPQILVGVYPDPKARKKIEDYLYHLNLREGINWWYI